MKGPTTSFLKRGIGVLLRLPIALRTVALSLPRLSGWVEERLSLQRLAATPLPSVEAARRAQFSEWHPEDLEPRLAFYGSQGWQSLTDEPSLADREQSRRGKEGVSLWIATRAFFETHAPAEGRQALLNALQQLTPETRLLVYAPHAFAFDAGDDFRWVPDWEEILSLARSIPSTRALEFNPGFDRNGFFHMILEKAPAHHGPKKGPIRAGHFFYLNVGASCSLGASAVVLSATGLRALRRVVPTAQEHSFLARVPEEVRVGLGDIAMGHYGPWLTGARRGGALTILYGPGDRFRKERHDSEFYERLQIRGSFEEQYRAAHMTIMQAGGRWRTADAWPHEGLCRWMDLPVSPAVFPRTKRRIAPPGRRTFCFVGLYDDHQKGLDIARELCRRCPDFQFIAVGCKPIGAQNCREYGAVDNRLPQFRRIVRQADFIVSPARDDAQPGTIAECGSLGLLPIITETTGYVLSFPRRMNAEDLDQCVAVLRDAQAAAPDEVMGWQALNADYIEKFHRLKACDILLDQYLVEAMEESVGERV